MFVSRLAKLLSSTFLVSSLCAASPVDLFSVAKRSPGNVQGAGSPVVIDTAGVYIRISAMNDGSLIGGYTAQDGADHVMRVVRSTNGAASWDHIGEVTRGNSASTDIDNAFPLQLPNGRVLYAFRNHDKPNGSYTFYRITVCYSDDGGATWHYLSTVDQRAANGVNGLWEPFLRLARDGSLQVYYSGEVSSPDQNNYMRISRDNGATWSAATTVSGADTTTSRDGMSAVAPIDNNGNLICVFENTESGNFAIDYVTSHDDGLTWGGRTRLYTPRNGKAAGAPYVHNVWGTLVVSFETNEDVTTAGTNTVDGGQMKVITSNNGMQSWVGPFVTGDAGSHWPSLFNLDPTHFLAVYSKDGLGAVSQVYQLVN